MNKNTIKMMKVMVLASAIFCYSAANATKIEKLGRSPQSDYFSAKITGFFQCLKSGRKADAKNSLSCIREYFDLATDGDETRVLRVVHESGISLEKEIDCEIVKDKFYFFSENESIKRCFEAQTNKGPSHAMFLLSNESPIKTRIQGFRTHERE